MSVALIIALVALAYLGLALTLYFTAPRMEELEALDQRPSRETGLKVGTSTETVKRYALRIGPELWAAYRHIFDITLRNPVGRALAFRLTQAALILMYPVRRLLFIRHLDSARKRVLVPVELFNRLASRELGSMPLMTTPVLLLEDDAANTTVETRAASLIIGAATLWRNIRRGTLYNMTLGLRCSDEVQYLFTRCAGLHELSRKPHAPFVAEHTDIPVGEYAAVFCGGHVYTVDLAGEAFTADDKARLVATLRAILQDSRARTQGAEPPPTLSLCTHAYDARQPAIRYKHRDFFQTVNHALFTVALIPEATPESINELAIEQFSHPQNCWNDKGIQILVYGNSKASIIPRFKNYCLGSSIAKTVSFIQQEGVKHDLSSVGEPAQAPALVHLAAPTFTSEELEALRFYRAEHALWMRRLPHVFSIPMGKQSFKDAQGTRVQTDSIFQTCLHLTYTKVFGQFPVMSEAVFMGLFQKIFSSSMEFSGTSEMLRLSEKLRGLDPSAGVPHAQLAADPELAPMLLAAARSHHQLTRFAKHGYITPNRLFAWFRTFTYHPLRLARVLAICFLPKGLRQWAPVRWTFALLQRTPLLSRMLALEAFDVSTSHLPAMPGLRGGFLQNCNFDRLPAFFSPDIDLPELLGGVYRPKLLVHYSIYENQVNLSPLFFNAKARARLPEFVQVLEFYLRVCSSIRQAGLPASQQGGASGSERTAA